MRYDQSCSFHVGRKRGLEVIYVYCHFCHILVPREWKAVVKGGRARLTERPIHTASPLWLSPALATLYSQATKAPLPQRLLHILQSSRLSSSESCRATHCSGFCGTARTTGCLEIKQQIAESQQIAS